MKYGINELGTVDWADSLLGSLRPARTVIVTVASGEGELLRGTMLMKEIVEDVATGKYVKYDGTADLVGVLNEDIDATDDDVKTYAMFDIDVRLGGLFSGVTTLDIGYYPGSAINIIGD